MSNLSVKWIYVLEHDFSYQLTAHLKPGFQPGCAFLDQDGVRRLEIHPDGTATVLATYAWNGCSPKFALWDILIGTPDGIPSSATLKPKTYYASLMHDALYQFLDQGLPLTRASADQIFLELMARDNFAPRWRRPDS